jgi:hypothetical protein
MLIRTKAAFVSGVILTAALACAGSTARADVSKPRIDPQAVAALDRMGAFLRAR